MFDFLIAMFLLLTGLAFLAFGLGLLRYNLARRKAEKFIRDRGYTSGPFVKHGMVIDHKTGLVRGTVEPSDTAILMFF